MDWLLELGYVSALFGVCVLLVVGAVQVSPHGFSLWSHESLRQDSAALLESVIRAQADSIGCPITQRCVVSSMFTTSVALGMAYVFRSVWSYRACPCRLANDTIRVTVHVTIEPK